VKVLKYASLKELDELPGYLTFGEAAEDLGVTGERVRQMAQEGKLRTAKRLGRRPVGIVTEGEIRAIVEKRKQGNPDSVLSEAEALAIIERLETEDAVSS
jgi:excisionase family DNA binding protein